MTDLQNTVNMGVLVLRQLFEEAEAQDAELELDLSVVEDESECGVCVCVCVCVCVFVTFECGGWGGGKYKRWARWEGVLLLVALKSAFREQVHHRGKSIAAVITCRTTPAAMV
jgi:hypothetical protein